MKKFLTMLILCVNLCGCQQLVSNDNLEAMRELCVASKGKFVIQTADINGQTYFQFVCKRVPDQQIPDTSEGT